AIQPRVKNVMRTECAANRSSRRSVWRSTRDGHASQCARWMVDSKADTWKYSSTSIDSALSRLAVVIGRNVGSNELIELALHGGRGPNAGRAQARGLQRWAIIQ